MTTTGQKPGRLESGAGTKPALSHRLAERGIDKMLLLLLPALLFALVLFVYPFIYGLGLSFQPKTGGLFGAYAKFFTDPSVRGLESIWVTLQLAVPAALINVLASVPIAYKMRGRFRGKRALTTVLVTNLCRLLVRLFGWLARHPRVGIPEGVVPRILRRAGYAPERWRDGAGHF